MKMLNVREIVEDQRGGFGAMDKTGRNTREEIDKIIEENKQELGKIINKLAHRYAPYKGYVADLKQVGWDQCVRSARRYDKDRHAKFGLFAYKRIRSAIRREAYNEDRHTGVRRNDFVAPSEEQKALIRDIVDTKLTDLERRIIHNKFWLGKKLHENAIDVDLTYRQVQFRLPIILEKLKQEFISVGITGYSYNKEEFARLEA